ncbi:MAG: glycosyltransferase [Peptococcia bacterium]
MEKENKEVFLKYNSAVIIPALNPPPKLLALVQDLLEQGFPHIIVVNDGSSGSFERIFQEIEAMDRCTVLHHETNRGKGRALKTAFSYVLENFPSLDGVITADADGQHSVDDICRISELLSQRQDSLILGERNFRSENVPRRSWLGNTLTSRVFQFLYGVYLHDTQTGLRGIPLHALDWMIEMVGERYDFELNMLIKLRNHNLGILTMPIKTIYYDNNAHSHFKTFRDTLPIVLRLVSGALKYSGSVLLSGIIDIIAFFVLNTIVLAAYPAATRLFASTALARLLSSICNFNVNRRLIFEAKDNILSSALRYYTVCVIQMLLSYGLVFAISLSWKVNESVIKLFVDFVLGTISYKLQLHWVFRNDHETIVNSINV